MNHAGCKLFNAYFYINKVKHTLSFCLDQQNKVEYKFSRSDLLKREGIEAK